MCRDYLTPHPRPRDFYLEEIPAILSSTSGSQNSGHSDVEKSSVPYWGLKRKGQDQGVGKKNEAEIPQTEAYGGPRETERYERHQQAGLLVWAFGSSLHLNSHEGKNDGVKKDSSSQVHGWRDASSLPLQLPLVVCPA